MAQGIDPAALIKGAVAALNRRDRKEVARLLKPLVQNPPPIDQHWASISRMASAVGETTTALLASRFYVAAQPRDLSRLLYHGAALGGFGRVHEALEVGRRALALAPNDANPHNLVATCYLQLGKLDEAREGFREAIRRRPTAGAVWVSLGAIHEIENDPQEFAQLQEVAKTVTDPEDLGAIQYALGRAYDNLQEYDRAFGAYSAGAAVLRKARPFNWAPIDAMRDRALNDFDANLRDTLAPSTCDSDLPIFVTGLPRSGTTLVEQILCAHSKVKDGAEHGLFRTALLDLDFATPGAIQRYEQTHGRCVWTSAADDFVGMVVDRFGAGGRNIDKALVNTRIIGLIAHALPKAPIIWLRRDPIDCAWSCFRHRFTQGNDWAWSLEDIARYFKDEDRIWTHWKKVLGERLLEVPYEELASSPDDWMRRIIAHCGLEFEPGVERFYLTDRVISTASVAQVRKPISTSAIAQWRKYERHLKPFTDVYGSA